MAYVLEHLRSFHIHRQPWSFNSVLHSVLLPDQASSFDMASKPYDQRGNYSLQQVCEAPPEEACQRN